MMRARVARLLAGMGLVGATGMTSAATMDSPVRLVAERTGATVTLSLTGAASRPVEATYQLDVEGASSVHQKGAARLTPGGEEALVRVTIDADRPWRATLHVTADGQAFDRTIDSDAVAG